MNDSSVAFCHRFPGSICAVSICASVSERKIAVAQSKAPGLQGYRFEPPVPGVQEDYVAILRFDSEANIQAWLDSPERAKLIEEAAPLTVEFHARMARTAARPVPRGKISPDEARAFGTVLAVGSVICLGLMANWLAAGLLALTIGFYVFV